MMLPPQLLSAAHYNAGADIIRYQLARAIATVISRVSITVPLRALYIFASLALRVSSVDVLSQIPP